MLKFAYLNLKDHPRGNIILLELLNNNFIPAIIIEENSSLAQKNKNAITSAVANFNFPQTKEMAAKHNIKVLEVDNHNDENCILELAKLNLDLIILGDTRVMKSGIINSARLGVINSHPGYLPDVRGNNPYIWALANNLPQGCSVHFIDENIDTGDLILREKIDLKTCPTYPDLLQTINSLCAKLMVEATKQISENTCVRIPQSQLEKSGDKVRTPTFLAAPSDVKITAIQKLEGGQIEGDQKLEGASSKRFQR